MIIDLTQRLLEKSRQAGYDAFWFGLRYQDNPHNVEINFDLWDAWNYYQGENHFIENMDTLYEKE